jgi:glycine cleavage system H protein
MDYPTNLKYTEDHEWIRVENDTTAYIGITDYAQSELGEIVYVEVESINEDLSAGEAFGIVEAVKTTSDLYMPVDGKVLEFNPALNADEGDKPELVNKSPYEKGWIVKVEISNPEQLEELLSAEDYAAKL